MIKTDHIEPKGKIIMPKSTAPAAPTPTTISPKEFALAAGTDPKTARRFLRSVIVDADTRPGKGGRWAIDSTILPELVKRFNARNSARTATITSLPEA